MSCANRKWSMASTSMPPCQECPRTDCLFRMKVHNKARKRSQKKQGFTLIELMILLAIIGILATIGIKKLSDTHWTTSPRETRIVKATNASSNYSVKRLFTVDGCTVYKFSDWGDRYFASCKGSTSWTEDCGKDCSRGVQIDTDRR